MEENANWNDPAELLNAVRPLLDDQIGSVLKWMRRHGSSVLLNYGEDNGLWECSWITGGVRFVGVSIHLGQAIGQSVEKAITTINDYSRGGV